MLSCGFCRFLTVVVFFFYEQDGSWDLVALELYLNMSKEKVSQFLDSCGLKSMGQTLRVKGQELFATEVVLAYLCSHFKVPVFTFAAVAEGAPKPVRAQVGPSKSNSFSLDLPLNAFVLLCVFFLFRFLSQKSTLTFQQKMDMAHQWAKKTEALLPALCDRLGIGVSWEVATRTLMFNTLFA